MEKGKKPPRLKPHLFPVLSLALVSCVLSCAGMPTAGSAFPDSLPAEKPGPFPSTPETPSPGSTVFSGTFPDAVKPSPANPSTTGTAGTFPDDGDIASVSPSGTGSVAVSSDGSGAAVAAGRRLPSRTPESSVPVAATVSGSRSSASSKTTDSGAGSGPGGAAVSPDAVPPSSLPDAGKADVPPLPLVASVAVKPTTAARKTIPDERPETSATVKTTPKPDFHRAGPLVRFEPDTGVFRTGKSGQGRDLAVRTFRGSRPSQAAIFLSGGIHGKYERNTVELMEAFSLYFSEHHSPVDVYVLENMNPDSFFADSRMGDDTPNGYRKQQKVGRAWYRFTSNYVDLNRNFATSSWRPDAWYGANDLRVGAGGREPFSEPESRFLAGSLSDLKTTYSMLYVVNFHCYTLSAGGRGVVQPAYSGTSSDPLVRESDLRFAGTYAKAAGYEVLPEWTLYEITGELLSWCGEHGIPAVDVELSGPDPIHEPLPEGSTHYRRNLNAVLSLVELISKNGADPFASR